MAKAKKTEVTIEEEEALNVDFAAAEPDTSNLLSAEELEKIEKEPNMTDENWVEYVMRQFKDSELDGDGNPLVPGLRRVVKLLLGPTLVSKAHVVQSPQLLGGEYATILQPAVVEYTVRILMLKMGGHRNLTEAYEVEYTDCADVYFGNTDYEYARHATSTASTKAEGRCLRKLLGLTRIAGEEKTNVPVAQANLTGFITSDQVNIIDMICRRLNINVMKFVCSGKKKFDAILDVPFGTAQKMIEHLSGLQSNPEGIPESAKGYVTNWRN